MNLAFGVFDHLDASGAPLRDFYEDRLRLVELYDRLGFYCYHVAEHHSTPLGMAPSPSVFLSAVAQRTRRLNFGPLVYTLPLYHPIRLIEEICMLDQMSGGRFQFGTGKVDFKGVFKVLKSARFNGPIMVECCAIGDTPDATAANARANREFLEKTLEEV